MVDKIGGNSRTPHPHSVSQSQRSQQPSSQLQGVVSKVTNAVDGHIAPVGKHTFKKTPSNRSLAKDVGRVAAEAFKGMKKVKR